MNATVKFVIGQLFTTTFWKLFLSVFTVVIMFEWRSSLRDSIFNAAKATR